MILLGKKTLDLIFCHSDRDKVDLRRGCVDWSLLKDLSTQLVIDDWLMNSVFDLVFNAVGACGLHCYTLFIGFRAEIIDLILEFIRLALEFFGNIIIKFFDLLVRSYPNTNLCSSLKYSTDTIYNAGSLSRAHATLSGGSLNSWNAASLGLLFLSLCSCQIFLSCDWGIFDRTSCSGSANLGFFLLWSRIVSLTNSCT